MSQTTEHHYGSCDCPKKGRVLVLLSRAQASSPDGSTGASSKSHNIPSSWESGKFPLDRIATRYLLILIMPNAVWFCDVCIGGPSLLHSSLYPPDLGEMASPVLGETPVGRSTALGMWIWRSRTLPRRKEFPSGINPNKKSTRNHFHNCLIKLVTENAHFHHYFKKNIFGISS